MPSNIQQTIFDTSLAGLGNYDTQDASVAAPSTSLSAFASVDFSVTVDMERTDAISQIQTRYTGIETVWRPLAGGHLVYKPNFASATETYQAFGSFSDNTLTVTVRVANPTATPRSSTAFTFECRVFLYKAPFA